MTNPNGWTGGTGEKITYLSDDQVTKFFAAIEAQKDPLKRKRDMCLFSLMLAYGCRCAEIPLIKLEHVRLRDYPVKSEIYVTRVKRKRTKEGKAKPRLGQWYDLSERNAEVVRAWMKVREKYETAALSDSLFVTKETGTFSLPHIYDSTVKYSKIAGLTDLPTKSGYVHPHQFRHTCGVRLAKAGRNAFAIQKRLGHVSVISTEVYVQIAGRDRHEEDRRDDEALEGGDDD